MVVKRNPPSLDMERELALEGATYIVGFDEVGRGSLAGPVMVGAVALEASTLDSLQVPERLTDSKLLAASVRENMLESLQAWPSAWAVGSASSQEIDELGITYALGLAALRALASVEQKLMLNDNLSPEQASSTQMAAILDGPFDYISRALSSMDAPTINSLLRVKTCVKADLSCASVACASVIAKVTRDRLMIELGHSQPEYAPYEWAKNKGYGSSAHRAAVKEHGPTIHHRMSWHLT